MAAHPTARRPLARPGLPCVGSRSARAAAAALAAVSIAVAVAACLPPVGRGDPGSASPGVSATPTSPPTPVSSGPTPRPSYLAPTPTPAPTFVVYQVGKGDSLNSIAKRFGTTARSIAFWNRATYPSLDPESSGYKPDLLQRGWTLLVIPNSVFDEQTLPEPSELIGPSPTPAPSYDDEESVEPEAS